jgi:hypothetical protein
VYPFGLLSWPSHSFASLSQALQFVVDIWFTIQPCSICYCFWSLSLCFFIAIIFESSTTSSHRLLRIFPPFLVPSIAAVAICFCTRWCFHSVNMTIPSKLKGFHKILIFLTTIIFSRLTKRPALDYQQGQIFYWSVCV